PSFPGSPHNPSTRYSFNLTVRTTGNLHLRDPRAYAKLIRSTHPCGHTGSCAVMNWNDVVAGDCLDVLAALPAGSADLVFADPPFNIGYGYAVYDDRRGRDDYLAWADRWLAAAVRILRPTGSLFLAIGDEYVAEHKVRLDGLGLHLRNWIVWHYTFGVSCTKKFNRSHAHILYYVVDPKRYTFNSDAVRVPSARQTTYADRRANPRGKL